jgi:nitrate reductase delta subunit
VDFRRLYHQAGYESLTGDLPDYLPLVLEYLSLNRNGDNYSLLGQYCEEVRTVHSRLEESGNAYADLLAIVANLFTEMKTMGV